MKGLIYSPLVRQYLTVVMANFSVFTTGMSLAWVSPVLVKLADDEDSPVGRPITTDEASWIVAGGFLCAVFSNILLGMLADIIGRKYTILLCFIPKLAVGILYIFATEVWMLILGRIIIIMFGNLIFIILPTYASEIASKEHRGGLGTLLQLFSSMGELVSLSVGPFTSYVTFNIIFTCVIAMAMIPVLFVPESPTHLLSKGRTEEAVKILKYLRVTDAAVQEDLKEHEINSHKINSIDKLSLFRRKPFRKALMLGLIICFGSQFVGFNAVTFYLQTILISANVSVRSEISSVIIGVLQVCTSFLSHALLSSRLGRKPILIATLTGLCVGMAGLGTFFFISEPEDYEITGFMNYLPLISLVLSICCFIAGVGSLQWVIIGEIFDDDSRAFGISITLTATTLSGFLIAKFFPTITESVGPAITYWFFSGMAVVLITLIIILLPETKGKTFSEIQSILNGTPIEKEKEWVHDEVKRSV